MLIRVLGSTYRPIQINAATSDIAQTSFSVVTFKRWAGSAKWGVSVRTSRSETLQIEDGCPSPWTGLCRLIATYSEHFARYGISLARGR